MAALWATRKRWPEYALDDPRARVASGRRDLRGRGRPRHQPHGARAGLRRDRARQSLAVQDGASEPRPVGGGARRRSRAPRRSAAVGSTRARRRTRARRSGSETDRPTRPDAVPRQPRRLPSATPGFRPAQPPPQRDAPSAGGPGSPQPPAGSGGGIAAGWVCRASTLGLRDRNVSRTGWPSARISRCSRARMSSAPASRYLTRRSTSESRDPRPGHRLRELLEHPEDAARLLQRRVILDDHQREVARSERIAGEDVEIALGVDDDEAAPFRAEQNPLEMERIVDLALELRGLGARWHVVHAVAPGTDRGGEAASPEGARHVVRGLRRCRLQPTLRREHPIEGRLVSRARGSAPASREPLASG